MTNLLLGKRIAAHAWQTTPKLLFFKKISKVKVFQVPLVVYPLYYYYFLSPLLQLNGCSVFHIETLFFVFLYVAWQILNAPLWGKCLLVSPRWSPRDPPASRGSPNGDPSVCVFTQTSFGKNPTGLESSYHGVRVCVCG